MKDFFSLIQSRLRMKERDNYVDNIRGLCIISVIFIHTVFWSGSEYVPDYIRNISLLFDVPVFFLLTGLTIAYTGKVNVLKQIYKLIYHFTAIIILYQVATFNFNIEDIVNSLTLNSAVIDILPLLNGSYWFVPMYCSALIVSVMLLKNNIPLTWGFIFVSVIYYINSYFNGYVFYGSVFNVPINNIFFYTSIILIGHNLHSTRGSSLWLISAFVFSFLIILISLKSGWQIKLQNYKFPVGLPYVTSSLITLSLVMFFTGWTSRSYITEIGENSIFYYISQAISSSIMMKISDFVLLTWIPKLILLFSVNVIIALFIGKILTWGFKKIEKKRIKIEY